MDAAGYWKQVRTPFYFQNPNDTVKGTILELLPMPRKDDPPGFWLQTDEGDVYLVTARQARLKFELKKLAPAVGDRIKVTYHGEAKKAAPGMNPTKEFTVEVRRPGAKQAENVS